LSLSPDVNDPGFREIDFDELKDVYREQCDALIEGGVDFILIETIFDTRTPGGHHGRRELREARGRDVPLMLSMTITTSPAATSPATRWKRFWHAVRHARPVTIGLKLLVRSAAASPARAALSAAAERSSWPIPTPAFPTSSAPMTSFRGDRGLIRDGPQRLRQHRRRLLRIEPGAYRGDGARGRRTAAAAPADVPVVTRLAGLEP
jgi:5-methyltetrahydrofolate--homocysteine methyltransferase